MSKVNPIEPYMKLLEDSLSPVTRSTRNKTILFSTIGLIIASSGVTPSNPVYFGLEFPDLTRGFVQLFVAAAILYSSFSFMIHAAVDRSKYKHLLDQLQNAKAIDLWSRYDMQKDDYEEMQKKEFKSVTGYDLDKTPKQSRGCISIRSILDFHFPWIYGLVCLIILGLNALCQSN